MTTIFDPIKLGDLELPNRIIMAPLTRCMAGPGLVPTEQMAAYYGRRADIGLIISEATIIRPDGQGYPNTPGLYSAEQIAGYEAQIEDLAAVVLMEVANRRATWGRWNLHAETMRQIMGVRFATTDDRLQVLDQIVAHAEAESLRLTPDYDRALPAHYVESEGDRFQPVDQIAYSSQDILDAEQRLLAHSQRTGPRKRRL